MAGHCLSSSPVQWSEDVPIGRGDKLVLARQLLQQFYRATSPPCEVAGWIYSVQGGLALPRIQNNGKARK